MYVAGTLFRGLGESVAMNITRIWRCNWSFQMMKFSFSFSEIIGNSFHCITCTLILTEESIEI